MPLNLKSVFPAEDPEFQSFPSRRSVVHSTEGMIACTQPLAARCGLKILDAGGNAAVSKSIPLLISSKADYIRMLRLLLVCQKCFNCS